VTEFARGADLYIREAQYTDDEYRTKVGWGHSTWSDVLESAHDTNARQLALYHHDPLHDDEIMDGIVNDCHAYMERRGMNFTCVAASDNLQVIV
jgi:ribonuclease BN (tRNA processing enzyme)